VNYTWDNKISFCHIFLKDWSTDREILSYPPTTGPLAVYKKETFYGYIDFAVQAVSKMSNLYNNISCINDNN